MNFNQILENLDKSDPQEAFYELAESMDIWDYVKEDKLTFHWVKSWICTDTIVGLKVYFYEDKPIAVGFKPFRKYKLQMFWVDFKTYATVKKYIESLLEVDDKIEVIEPDYDFDKLVNSYSY